MALSKHLRSERQVPSYFLVMGTILVGVFLMTVWLLSPSSEVIPETISPPTQNKKIGPIKQETLEASKEEHIKDEGQDLSHNTEDGETSGKNPETVDNDEDELEGKPIGGKGKNTEIQHETEIEGSKDKDAVAEDGENITNFESGKEEKNEAQTDGIADRNATQQEMMVGGHKDQKVQLPEDTAAAELELTSENKEMPKNWTTQVTESNEEKKMVTDSVPETQENVETELQTDAESGQDAIQDNKGNKPESLNGEQIKEEQRDNVGQERGKSDDELEIETEEHAGNEMNKDTTVREDKVEEVAKLGSDVVDDVKNNTPEHLDGQEQAGETPEKSYGLGGQNTEKALAYDWKICKWQGAMDYIPCLENKEAIKKLPSIRRFQHRERHCPSADKFPLCLVPLPQGYKLPIRWPRSRDEIWFTNVPHPKLVSYKKDQNWVRIEGDKLIFPGGGTQFKHGASEYINNVEKFVGDVAWGKHTRVVLDIGCGVASFGGYLFEKDVLTMSFAPKDEHEAQVQLALERGIPAISAVVGTQRLPFPSNAFDLAHCARCRIHWDGDGGKRLIEVNRLLRPGGYFVWSATPVYRNQPEDLEFWKAMVALTESMCWKLTAKVKGISSGVGFAIYQKPTSNSCYDRRVKMDPPVCNKKENPDAAWYTPLEECLQSIPTDTGIHGAEWPQAWPQRLDSTPRWLNNSQKSLFGQPAAVEFQMDTEHWRRVVGKSYLEGLGIDWTSIRNVMDMKAGYGGFAAALSGLPLWVMNVVPIDEPDTLPVIFDRGLFGIYHNWCESFNTYPRTYDLLHVDHLFKRLVSRCKPVYSLLEMDQILRPEGWVIFRDKSNILNEILPIIQSLHWNVGHTYVEGEEQLLVAQKGHWRPEASQSKS